MDIPSPHKGNKKPLSGGRRDYGLTVIGLSIVLIFWWWRIGTVPDIPTPRMPVPNAHDTYVAAGNALKDTKKIEFAIQLDHTSTDINDHHYTLAQKQALLNENQAVLAQIPTGLRQEYYAPPIRSATTPTAYYVRFRNMARLLRLKEQVQEAKGDWNGSVESTLDAIQMGTQILHGATSIGNQVGFAIQAIGRHDVWSAVEHINAAQSRRAIARLQQIRAQAVPLTAMMQEESWEVQACLHESFENPEWVKNCTSIYNHGNEEKTSFQQWISQTRVKLNGKRGITMNYIRYIDQFRELAKSRFGAHLKYPEVSSDAVAQLFVPPFKILNFRDAGNQTQNDMLLLSLCLRVYRLEHNVYPYTLNELSPAYLPQLPEDPFAAKGTYGYKLKGRTYVLYSVGPDGRDDGGNSIEDKTKISKLLPNNIRCYVVHYESKGDIVAGINP